MALIPARILVVMGVASSGKTVTGKAIARRLHAPFLDGDDFHPAANKDKMRAGIPLTDEDRWPWLAALARGLHEAAGHKGVAVGACSALRRAYRDYLIQEAGEAILFVFLEGTPEVIGARIATRIPTTPLRIFIVVFLRASSRRWRSRAATRTCWPFRSPSPSKPLPNTSCERRPI